LRPGGGLGPRQCLCSCIARVFECPLSTRCGPSTVQPDISAQPAGVDVYRSVRVLPVVLGKSVPIHLGGQRVGLALRGCLRLTVNPGYGGTLQTPHQLRGLTIAGKIQPHPSRVGLPGYRALHGPWHERLSGPADGCSGSGWGSGTPTCLIVGTVYPRRWSSGSFSIWARSGFVKRTAVVRSHYSKPELISTIGNP
jgi:hypothetical protein